MTTTDAHPRSRPNSTRWTFLAGLVVVSAVAAVLVSEAGNRSDSALPGQPGQEVVDCDDSTPPTAAIDPTANPRTAEEIANEAYDRIAQAEPIEVGRIDPEAAGVERGAETVDESARLACIAAALESVPTTAMVQPTGPNQTTVVTTVPVTATTGTTQPGSVTTGPSSTAPPRATIAGTVIYRDDMARIAMVVDVYLANADGSRGHFLAGPSTRTSGERYETQVEAGCYVVVLVAPSGAWFTETKSGFFEGIGCVKEGESLTIEPATVYRR